MEPPWEGEAKVYINGPGHMTKMAAMPINGKPLKNRLLQNQNIFSSETTWPINAKFHVEPPSEGRTKVYINGPGNMTKVAAMPIYVKNL